ncbi:MAG TPA: hypothetical protein VD971_12660 [Phycisphaerales bacterium]|nr:hypothetical protein [Phycisphaerales bacterium]
MLSARMNVRARVAAVVASLAGAAAAWAGVPPVLDRIPADAAIVVAIEDADRFDKNIRSLLAGLKAEEVLGQMGELETIMNAPGLKRNGSAALFMMEVPKDDDGGEDGVGDADEDGDDADGADADAPADDGLVLVPVSDFDALTKHFKGEKAGNAFRVTVGDDPAYCRDIGGGYAVFGPSQERVEAFVAPEGQLKTHTSMIGESGRRIADKADAMLIVNLPKFKGTIEETAAGMDDALDNMPPMPGMEEQIKAQMQTVQGMMRRFAADGQRAVLALGANGDGVWLDMGAQFSEGSESAKMFASEGDAASILARLPDQPFIMAFAADTSAPAIKEALASLMPAGDDNKIGGVFGAAQQLMRNADGGAMLMGASPAGAQAFFANTIYYTKTSKPQETLGALREMFKGLDGFEQMGITYKIDYQNEADDVAGVKVDSYKMTLQADQNDPMAQQMAMMQGMMFGGAIAGYVAPTQNGIVYTYARNKLLLKEAITAANEANGLGDSEDIKTIRSRLPEDRVVEGYIGVGNIMEMVQGFMAMMGGGAEVDVPDNLPPVGVGVSTLSGGLQGRVYVPVQVINAVRDMAEEVRKAQDGMEGDDMEEEGEGEAPRF